MFLSKGYFNLLFFLLIPFFSSMAKDLIIEKNSNGKIFIAEHISMLRGVHTDVANGFIPDDQEDWLPLEDSVLSGGYGQVYWFKLNITNHASNQFLVLKDGTIDYLDVFFVKDSTLIRQVSTGDQRPFNTRDVKVYDFVYKLPMDSFECYILIKNGVDFKSCLYVSSFQHLIEHFQNSNLLWGGYIGILFVLIFYNFFIYLSTKEKAMLWYVFYLITLIISSCGSKGIGFQYLWQDKAFINSFLPSLTSVYLIVMILFVNALLQIKKYDHTAFSILKGFIGLYLLSIGLNFIGFIQVWLIIQFSSILLSAYLFVLGFKIHLKGQPVAKYFLLTWSLHLFLIILFVFQLKGYMYYHPFLINGLFIGSALEATLLSMVVGYKIRVLRFQKEAAEKREISKHKEQYMFLREQAHEIQNPIYFVSNYVGVLDRNFSYMSKLLLLYREFRKCKKNSHLKKQEIIKFEKAIHLKTVTKELFDGLQSVQVAINRVENVSKNFLTHSQQKQSFNINKCLKETLSIIRLNLKDSITIHEDLEELNLFQGVPVRLEQVFMNLLKNALESIQEKVLLKEEYVIVKTSQSHHQICIEISDSGVGMSADTQQKIFSDDFTTKPKGKGVGMGFCKRIIEEHCGTIEIFSVLGKGTKVSIYLDTT
jgi:signal transduction histidine kinase